MRRRASSSPADFPRGRIRREWISGVADQLRMSADEATRRLRAQKFVVLDGVPDPDLDAAIVGEIGEPSPRETVIFSDQSHPVDRRAIVGFAVRTGRRMDRVAADLRALGFIVPPVGDKRIDPRLQPANARAAFSSQIAGVSAARLRHCCC